MSFASGKLLERIIWNMIYSHLEENGIIRDCLHGFVGGCSCLTKFYEVIIMDMLGRRNRFSAA